jgi:hypothetical protein
LVDEQPKDELPIMECQRVQSDDGTDRFQFVCPKCGKTRTHGASNSFRMSHCTNHIGLDESGEPVKLMPDCWPNGYILKERNGR